MYMYIHVCTAPCMIFGIAIPTLFIILMKMFLLLYNMCVHVHVHVCTCALCTPVDAFSYTCKINGLIVAVDMVL